jgi:hypothetical protein
VGLATQCRRRHWLTGGPGAQCRAAVQTGFEQHPEFKNFKQIQTVSNFGQLEMCFPELRKIKIKYGWKGFVTRNNFDYR